MTYFLPAYFTWVRQSGELFIVSYHSELITGELPNLEISRFGMQNIEISIFGMQNIEISIFDMQNIEIFNIWHAES